MIWSLLSAMLGWVKKQRGKFVWNGFSVKGGGVDDALW
jgi:hypothetical protein